MKPHARSTRFVPAALGLAFLVACQKAPVVWSDAVWMPLSPGRLAVDSGGRTRLVAPLPAPPTLPGGATRCEQSFRFAWVDSMRVFAAWWTPRPDRSAALMASYSADGGRTWKAPSPVDSSDVSAVGCDRPAPALAADGSTVHVAYSLTSSEGTGIFFAHSMDNAGLFHSPVPVEYGSRLGAAAVAARGDRVLVAYEDPDDRSRIGLAISATMGHIFESHASATDDVGEATSPDIALNGRTLAVSWTDRASPDGARAVRMIRVGRLR